MLLTACLDCSSAYCFRLVLVALCITDVEDDPACEASGMEAADTDAEQRTKAAATDSGG